MPKVGLITVLVFLPSMLMAEEIYTKATIDKAGQLHITTKDGRTITPKKTGDQVSFEKAAISEDGRAVGWLNVYPNCCTSYPIPHELVVRMNGKEYVFGRDGLPVWEWRFNANGKQVAFHMETVHGGMGYHHELRDIATNRLIAEYSHEGDGEESLDVWLEKWNAPVGIRG